MLPESIANPHLHISDHFKTLNPSFFTKNAQNSPIVGITIF